MGSPPAPKTYSPMEQAQAQAMLDQQSFERQQAAAAAERTRTEQQKQADIARTQDRTNSAFATGQSYGSTRGSTLGYNDTFGLLDTYNQMLNTARTKVPEVSSDPASYFNYDQMWNDATNRVQSAEQMRLDNQFRGLTPVGWQESYFADSADDSILDAILGEQYGTAFDTIDAARARGQLSQGGFENTLRALDTKKLAARATLEDMGLGVLGGYRDELSGIADQYGDQISGYKLGQNLNLDDFTAQLGNRQGALNNRMRGDIYRTIGDTQLFNTDALMARGGSQAGVSNNPLRNAFRDQSVTDPTRTTGTTGVF